MHNTIRLHTLIIMIKERNTCKSSPSILSSPFNFRTNEITNLKTFCIIFHRIIPFFHPLPSALTKKYYPRGSIGARHNKCNPRLSGFPDREKDDIFGIAADTEEGRKFPAEAIITLWRSILYVNCSRAERGIIRPSRDLECRGLLL